MAARPCKLLLAIAAAAQATTWGGLRNQGNTCYLNSLLQTLFHVPALRSDVLGRPAEPRGLMKRLRTAPRPARALADVFKRLAQNATAQTRGLTRALGVSGLQQQDAQEYLRLLVGELCEDAALGDRVRSCYEGRAENFLEATDEEAERLGERPAKIREEAFLDVSLDVEAEDGTVEGALQRYLEPEILDGENRWASPAGRCAARKGVRFARLPSVIVLHLKRFAYDYMRDEVQKKGAPLRVPFRLPAAAFERAAPVAEAAESESEEGEEAVAPAGAEEAPPDDDRDPYLLHAVVVHVGGGRGGHYYAYVDPLLDGRWVKFDDDRVSAADARVVAAEAAGAELGGGNSVGAYLLQYVRASEAPRLGLRRGGAAEL